MILPSGSLPPTIIQDRQTATRLGDAIEAAKKQRTVLDDIEEKVMASTALAAAAAGTPEQAKAILAKARSKFFQAAADGADTRALEAMVQNLEHLARVADHNHERKHAGGLDPSAAIIPKLMTLGGKN